MTRWTTARFFLPYSYNASSNVTLISSYFSKNISGQFSHEELFPKYLSKSFKILQIFGCSSSKKNLRFLFSQVICLKKLKVIFIFEHFYYITFCHTSEWKIFILCQPQTLWVHKAWECWATYITILAKESWSSILKLNSVFHHFRSINTKKL